MVEGTHPYTCAAKDRTNATLRRKKPGKCISKPHGEDIFEKRKAEIAPDAYARCCEPITHP